MPATRCFGLWCRFSGWSFSRRRSRPRGCFFTASGSPLVAKVLFLQCILLTTTTTTATTTTRIRETRAGGARRRRRVSSLRHVSFLFFFGLYFYMYSTYYSDDDSDDDDLDQGDDCRGAQTSPRCVDLFTNVFLLPTAKTTSNIYLNILNIYLYDCSLWCV